jgi:isopenicillin-N epimerase
LLEFDWAGTVDPSATLTIPHAIRWMQARADALGLGPGGWMAKNRALALEGRAILASMLGLVLPCPDEMIGSMAALPLPDGPDGPVNPLKAAPLQEALFSGSPSIEVPIVPWPAPPRRLVRISAQLYNTPEEVRALGARLKKILQPG